MGKKKAFIKRGEGQHFYLLHRSQTDEAYAGEERPSDYVLVSSDKNDVKPKIVAFEDEGRGAAFDFKSYAKAKRQKDHITDLGFVNDGYDYTQHLMESDGGSFYGKDGKFYEMKPKATGSASSSSSSGLHLPPEALPSGKELERDLQAITLDHTLMDSDLAAALFEHEDDEGEFEELQDDFVLSVMQEPEVPDFDFDAHMARLIALSERRTQPSKSGQEARGWESKGSKKGEEEGEDDDDEDEDGYFSDTFSADEEGVGSSGPHRKKSVTEKRISDERFETLLDEYGEEQLGYGNEDDEEDELQGGIDIAEGNVMFEDALDEFLTDKKDEIFAEGTLIKDVIFNKSYWNEPGQDVRDEKVRKDNYIEQMMEQVVLDDVVRDKTKRGDDAIEDLMKSQTYLSEERVEDEWDCESVLSTYSTLDNHPKLIKEPGAGFRPRSNRYTRSVEAQYNGDGASSMLSGSSSTRNVTTNKVGTLSMTRNIAIGSGKAEKIILKGKLGLPSTDKAPVQEGTVPLTKQVLQKIDEAAVDDSDSDDDNGDDDRCSDDETTMTHRTDRSHRNKDETPEEKRVRKAAVKEERREKRAQKKQLKGIFVSEQQRQVRDMARQQDINSVPVFKYSH